MDEFHVPLRSPSEAMDDMDREIEEDYEMQDAQQQEHLDSHFVGFSNDVELGENGGDQWTPPRADPAEAEDDYEYEDEEDDTLVAATVQHASGAASSSNAGRGSGAARGSGDFNSLPWSSKFVPIASRASRKGKQPTRSSKFVVGDDDDDDDHQEPQPANARRTPLAGDGLDDRVERTARREPPAAAGSSSNFDDAESSLFGESGNGSYDADDRRKYVDARCMSDYNSFDMGRTIVAKVPEFGHGNSLNSTWMSYDEVGATRDFMRPVRAMCWNIPVQVLARHGTRFSQWTSPQKGYLRASSIASILSFVFTGTSKGFLSGAHEELSRANGDADEDDNEDQKVKLKRVHRYAFMLTLDNKVTVPMFTICYEELYDPTNTKVVAIRIWKMVYDKSHSDSDLCRKLLDENRDTFVNAGAAHAPNNLRRKDLVAAQKNNRVFANSSLEHNCGLQYQVIQNEELWYRHITNYGGGHNVNNNKRPFFNDEELPTGINNKRIMGDSELGGTHPLSPEYVFNAKRSMALCAGLVDFDDEYIEVHPDQLEPSNYFTDDHHFIVPRNVRKNDCFFFCVNSYVTNIFDVSLPRKIYGSASAGDNLIDLFIEMNPELELGKDGSRSKASEYFENMMTQEDPVAKELARNMTNGAFTYDSLDVDPSKVSVWAHYGARDTETDEYIMEPQQVCKRLQQEMRRVFSELIKPWAKKREMVRAEAHSKVLQKMKEANAKATGAPQDAVDVDYHDEMMEPVRAIEEETTRRHHNVVKDAAELHLSRLEEAFNSKEFRSQIPAGYKAMFDGLQHELDSMPNRTASIAFAQDVSLQFEDMSSFAHINLWLGEFFEKDCFVEGRDRRIFDEIFLHCFEQYADVTFLLLLCGTKGNGKSTRAERAAYIFPEGWTTTGGQSSEKSGQNGQSDACDGKNVFYDEMVPELMNPEATNKIEYWKQILSARQYTSARTVCVKDPNGQDTHRTAQIRTPHNETHLICTNNGMAFTNDGRPSDAKAAFIDRSVYQNIRSIGTRNSDKNEFLEHMSKPEQKMKLSRFRLYVCLVGAVKLAIQGVPEFQPNLAYANTIFDYLDKKIIVGEYNLPRTSPRKSLKREENLRTLCIMKAVADVFVYKQTAVEFEAGRLGDDGKPQPFKFTMLYDVIRQLRATPELIYHAWSMSLDYNVGTSSATLTSMTVMCEEFGMKIGSWFMEPDNTNPADFIVPNTGSPTAGQPVRKDGETDEEFEQQKAQYRFQQQEKLAQVADNFSKLPSILDLNKFDRKKRKEALLSFERVRRATSSYRHTCTLDANADIAMTKVSDTIETIMKRYKDPLDMTDEEKAVEKGNFLPIYPSLIMASAVQLCSVYDLNSVAHWCANAGVHSTKVHNIFTGTNENFNFTERQSKGPCKFSTGWLRTVAKSGWSSLATHSVTGSKTCKIFDMSEASLRDCFMMMASRDNSRRCTEEPRDLPYHVRKEYAFTDSRGGILTDNMAGQIKMRGVTDKRDGNHRHLDPGTEEMPRHPYALIPKVPLQKKIDFLNQYNRFPAMMSLVSNNVRDCAPMRLTYEGETRFVELNLSAAFQHMQMLAESIMRCSLMPGVANMQERFCSDGQGPEGLSIDFTAQEEPQAHGQGSSSDAGTSGGEIALSDLDKCTKLPYSYDIIQISMTADVMSRLYDSGQEETLKMYREHFGKLLDFWPKKEDLPHMCMRFVGLADEASRMFVSLPVADSPKAFQEAVPIGNVSRNPDEMKTVVRHLRLSLGHYPTDDEIDRYLKSRDGSRSMSGVTGDLFDTQTYIQHTLTTFKDRGFIFSEDDPVASLVADDVCGLRTRVIEIASRKINMLVENDPSMKHAQEFTPPDAASMTDEQILDKRNEQIHNVRNRLYKTVRLPKGLEGFRQYGPLNVQSTTKMTFEHREKVEEKRMLELSRRKIRERQRQLDSSSQFKDSERIRKRALPGLVKPTGVGTLRTRGFESSRGKAPMRQ